MKEQSAIGEGVPDAEALRSATEIAAWRQLLGLGRAEELRRQGCIFVQGAPVEALYLIEGGLLKLTHLGADGRKAILGLRTPGQFAEHCTLALPTTHIATAEAVTDMQFHRIRDQDLSELLRTSREASDLFRIQQSFDLLHASEEIMSLRVESAEERFERLLRRLAGIQIYGHQGRWFHVDAFLSNAEFAALVSISPEHLSRIKKKMLKAGRLQRHGNALLFPISEAVREAG